MIIATSNFVVADIWPASILIRPRWVVGRYNRYNITPRQNTPFNPLPIQWLLKISRWYRTLRDGRSPQLDIPLHRECTTFVSQSSYKCCTQELINKPLNLQVIRDAIPLPLVLAAGALLGSCFTTLLSCFGFNYVVSFGIIGLVLVSYPISAYLTHLGFCKNAHMHGVIPGTTTGRIPGNVEGVGCPEFCVVLIMARCNGAMIVMSSFSSKSDITIRQAHLVYSTQTLNGSWSLSLPWSKISKGAQIPVLWTLSHTDQPEWETITVVSPCSTLRVRTTFTNGPKQVFIIGDL